MYLKAVRFGLMSVVLASSSTFCERFLNVSNKKVKVSVVDTNGDSEIKSFVLSPMSHKILDLGQLKKSGITVAVKQMRSSYLLDKKRDKSDKCGQCGQVVEARCGCQKAPKKEKKDVALEVEVAPAEMNVQNEIIIIDSAEGLQVRLFGSKASALSNKE